MGMTIEEAIKYYENKNVVLTEEEALANTLALNTMRKYQQLQADYENRLKADLVAMLTEIREKAWYHHSRFDDDKDFEVDRAVEDIVNYIDSKINSLKEA